MQSLVFEITPSATTYRWQAENAREQTKFIASLIKLFQFVTGGTVPLRLIGVKVPDSATCTNLSSELIMSMALTIVRKHQKPSLLPRASTCGVCKVHSLCTTPPRLVALRLKAVRDQLNPSSRVLLLSSGNVRSTYHSCHRYLLLPSRSDLAERRSASPRLYTIQGLSTMAWLCCF